MALSPARPLVLVVTSWPYGLEDMLRSLQRAELAVTEADSASAVDAARRAPPDLVLVDARASHMRATETTERLRAEAATAGVPVVHLVARLPPDEEATDGGGPVDARILWPLTGSELALLAVTARRQQAARTADARAEVLRSSQERKDEFIATLGHELRNPLGVVRAGLSLMSQREIDETRGARVRVLMQRQVDTLVRLADDLLDAARIAHGKLFLSKRPVDLRTLVEGALEAARPRFEAKGVALSSAIGGDPVVVDGDASRLAQVLSNVLDNAWKFTPAGGSVHLSLGLEERASGRWCLLRVKDTGVGIAAHDLDSLCELFFQSGPPSRASRGLGIGLALVRRIVELHGGAVQITSAGPGCGAECIIEFPVLSAIAELPAEPDAASPHAVRAPLRQRRVLFVDDHADTRQLTKELLEYEGHQVTLADDGQAAIALLLRESFDVAIVDLMLPALDGYEVARLARSRLAKDAPLLVALTGFGGEREREASRRAGFDVHLVKPVEPATLLETIAESAARQRSN